MLSLPVHHEDSTFTYDQVMREGDVAIFRQVHKVSKIERFEVVQIRVRAAQEWPDGRVTPEHEAYPGTNSWGTLGFTCFSLADAQALAQQLRDRAAASAP
jgi:hypothetical protein